MKTLSTIILGSLVFMVMSTRVDAVDVVVQGNGSQSDTSVVVESVNADVVDQKSINHIITEIESRSNTGRLSSDKNTGGEAIQESGDTETEVIVETNVGLNEAMVADNCGCADEDTVTVKNNGYKSDQRTRITKLQERIVGQGSKNTVKTVENALSNTGDSSVSKNTGTGTDQSSGDTWTRIVTRISGGYNYFSRM